MTARRFYPEHCPTGDQLVGALPGSAPEATVPVLRTLDVANSAADAGYQSIYWTLDSLDSVGDKKNPEFIVSRILNPPKSGDDADHYLDGAIILMHVGEPDTARAVPLLIKALRERGFRLVTVEEIVNPSPAVQTQ